MATGLAFQRAVLVVIPGLALIACGGPGPGLGPTSSPPSTAGTASPPGTASPTSGSPGLTVEFELIAVHGADAIPGLVVAPGYLTASDNQLLVPSGPDTILVIGADGSLVDTWPAADDAIEFDFLRQPDDPGSALGEVAVAGDGTIYVVEGGAKRVQVLTADREPLRSWGSVGEGDGQFLDPIGIAIGSDGLVYVVDDVRNDIQVFTPDGEFVRIVGSKGRGTGQLWDTGNIRIDEAGVLVNADFGNSRVQAWDASGAPLWSFGSEGTGPGQFVEPQDVAFGPSGVLLVEDDARVQAFDSERRFLGSWTVPDSGVHLGSIALLGDRLWVVAPYSPALYEISVSVR